MTDKRSALIKKYTPISEAQLKEVVAQYAACFPEWVVFVDGTAFIRREGPIQQMIWFQRMRSAAYRPTHGISSIVLPEVHIRMLAQVLDVKHREVEHRWHERKFAATVAVIEEQFQPNVRKPLDIAEVLMLCETEAAAMPDTTNNMAMLAILNAWLGRDREALDHCDRMQHCPLPTLGPIPEWEVKMRAFGRDLTKAVESGSARGFLESAVGINN